MRLRLTIQRNRLPDANIVWNVPDTNSSQAYTITRLLEDVNKVIPLEAEHWGLEHYVVEVGGFECLHFSPVVQALKEDDHVSIRPLMTAEERARTLTGRHQISEDGRHLVDGVPFGRPYLRHPNRPAIRIPPRKRRRLDGDDEGSETTGILMTTDDDTSTGSEKETRMNTTTKTVQFEGPELDEDSDEDDSDFGSDDESSTDSDSNSNAEPNSSTASGTSSSDSSSHNASGDSDSDSDSDNSSSSDSDSDSESDASAPPDIMSSKSVKGLANTDTLSSPKLVPPGRGRSVTQSRNKRRSRANRLRILKEAGTLPPNATLKDLEQHELEHPPQKSSSSYLPRPFATFEGKRKRVDEEEFEQQFEGFKEDTESTMVDVERPQQIAQAQKQASPQELVEDEQPTRKEMAKKRLRPDVSAISRILARQAMPSKKASKTKTVIEELPEPAGASDPDFWKSKISLSAFECWDENFELSAPPFPFKQHWDPASKLMREKDNKKRQKKGGKNKRESMPAQEEEEEDKIYLDYDDTGATENPESELTVAIAIEDQLRLDVATAVQSDIPPIPDDLSTLPVLNSGEIKEGAIIVCKFWAVNPVTVTPEISGYKTAVVDREGDSGNGAGTIRLKIAERDLPKREKKFDRNGERVYDVADRFYMEDEEEDDSIWEGQFGELLEPKLLKAA
ncbi:hypothetical protein GQ44DRAFT_741155 [Phaeosphaeriaceae sp. PMI808]|nr:hypothetical protein GQ44DRAFT_741155 [Phaeosphaeriaceae sp. PMI808]